MKLILKVIISLIILSTFAIQITYASGPSSEGIINDPIIQTNQQVNNEANQNNKDPVKINTDEESIPNSEINSATFDLSNAENGGINIDSAFKPINAPEAINRSYGTHTINAFLQFLAGSIIEITGGISIFILVIAGYIYVTAFGDTGKTDKAKDIVKWTIVGMLTIILSFTIVKTIISLILEVDMF